VILLVFVSSCREYVDVNRIQLLVNIGEGFGQLLLVMTLVSSSPHACFFWFYWLLLVFFDDGFCRLYMLAMMSCLRIVWVYPMMRDQKQRWEEGVRCS